MESPAQSSSCSQLTINRNNNWTNVLPGLGLSDCDSVLDSNTMHANELNNEQPDLVQTMQAQQGGGGGERSGHCATNFQLQQQLEHYGPSGSVKVSVSQQECTLTPLKGCARMSEQQSSRAGRVVCFSGYLPGQAATRLNTLNVIKSPVSVRWHSLSLYLSRLLLLPRSNFRLPFPSDTQSMSR